MDCASAVLPARSTVAFVDVNVVPMDSERLLAHQTVVVSGERIVALGPVESTRVPAGAVRVEGQGRYLMPGLVDMHLHLVPGVGQPEDLDALIVMLASDQSHFINGAVIAADDGFGI